MPKLNLKGEMDEMSTPSEPEQVTPPPSLRDIPESKGPSPLIQVFLAVIILGAITFALNYFGVVHLWGKKTPQVTEALPEPSLPPPPAVEPKVEVIPTPTPTPTPVTPTPTPAGKPKVSVPATGTGDFTVQVSSWMSKSKADSEAERLAGGGFSSFVQDAVVSGEHWYRVRIGRYANQKEAAEAAADLQTKLENGFWVAKVGP